METIWTKSPWTMEQLEHQTVEFEIPDDDQWVHGFGKFLVRQNPEGLLAIEIAVDQLKSLAEMFQWRYPLPQAGVDAILDHPDREKARFQLFCKH